MPLTIISGGQTGADRAGLDFAIANGLEHGGWCPRGRKALDGPLPARYRLQETPSAEYPQRTEWNARDSDGTAVFTLGEKATGGSAKTLFFAGAHRRPSVHIHPGLEDPAGALRDFVERHNISRLNVAGSRESKEPGLYAWAFGVLEGAGLGRTGASLGFECREPVATFVFESRKVGVARWRLASEGGDAGCLSMVRDLIPLKEVFPVAMIEHIGVPDGMRGQGFGTAILRAALSDAKAAGARIAFLTIGVSDEDRAAEETRRKTAWFLREGFKILRSEDSGLQPFFWHPLNALSAPSIKDLRMVRVVHRKTTSPWLDESMVIDDEGDVSR